MTRKGDDKGDFDDGKLLEFIDMNLNKFHISSVYLKKYPFCRHIHSAIDSTLALKNDSKDLKDLNNLKKDCSDISSIDIETYKIASEHDNYTPKNAQDLKQSLPYAVAIALALDDLSLDSIDELISFATIASALHVQKKYIINAVPTKKEVCDMYKKKGV